MGDLIWLLINPDGSSPAMVKLGLVTAYPLYDQLFGNNDACY